MNLNLRYLHPKNFHAWVVLILLMLFCQSHIEAQSPYRTSFGQEMTFSGAGLALIGTGAYLRSQITLFTPEELELLDRFYVNEFDRTATQMLSDHADRLSDHFVNTAQILPLLFLAGKDARSSFGQIAVMYGETMLITGGLTTITKYGFHRPRPYVYNGEASLSSIQSINAQASFVSGHTSTTAAATFFIAKVYSDFYPTSEWKPVIWTAAAIAPAITGYLRVRAGKHYPTDVIGGYALGAAVGFLVPHLHLDKGRRNREILLTAIPNGMYLQMKF